MVCVELSPAPEKPFRRSDSNLGPFSRQGKTALHVAAEKGKTAAVEALIAARSDIAATGECVSGKYGRG